MSSICITLLSIYQQKCFFPHFDVHLTSIFSVKDLIPHENTFWNCCFAEDDLLLPVSLQWKTDIFSLPVLLTTPSCYPALPLRDVPPAQPLKLDAFFQARFALRLWVIAIALLHFNRRYNLQATIFPNTKKLTSTLIQSFRCDNEGIGPKSVRLHKELQDFNNVSRATLEAELVILGNWLLKHFCCVLIL